MKITAIILDGFHKGHVIRGDYIDRIKLLKPKHNIVDMCCDGEINSTVDIDYIEYKECFRAVDKKVVMYSLSGKSDDYVMQQTHNVSSKIWNINTELYFGYHNEPAIRKDDGTQMTDYEKGLERGIEEGRIMQQKEIDKRYS